MIEGQKYSLLVRLSDVIERDGQFYYGEREFQLILPIITVEQLSPAIDEEHYVSFEKECEYLSVLSARIATPGTVSYTHLRRHNSHESPTLALYRKLRNRSVRLPL